MLMMYPRCPTLSPLVQIQLLNGLFEFTDKCFECSSNGIKQGDLFLEARLLLSRAGDAVRGGGNSLAKSGNLGVSLPLASLRGELLVRFDHVGTGARSGDVTPGLP